MEMCKSTPDTPEKAFEECDKDSDGKLGDEEWEPCY
jgi:hypothetical protein